MAEIWRHTLNVRTGRYHPMCYRWAPPPGPFPGPGLDAAGRYRSAGHHTEGFATFQEAVLYVMGLPGGGELDTGELVAWDSEEGSPASVDFFSPEAIRRSPKPWQEEARRGVLADRATPEDLAAIRGKIARYKAGLAEAVAAA